ncbi:TonB-dependent receptor [Malaciobacter molluscorum LMG 25693]|uniref:TonB-dependent receptor n=1 Tax=Malaciobacter molluscorum LMG 25693 TaxID=870501 RepID=A0A2G1DGE3_9BACT|nr:TonB-dependent receptor [Malaciobacter molluscorum]AXX91471.1 TonB-dependent receptor [Malaciobacter molluscorum LMG 25693]PHO17557.1 TonB-dependent receptor [Malaciobacter molluscorum LMG 25693]
MNLKRHLVASLSIFSTLTFANASNEKSIGDVTVVSASGFDQNITDAPASISVITAAELEKKSYTDISDALKNVPGVFVSGGGSNQSIMIRGMSSGYTLYLVDGRPMQGGDAFELNGQLKGAQMNFLPSIDEIERIEIIRGPASSRYGSDAMGGVINIITKRNVDKFTAKISSEYIMADSKNEVNNDSVQTNLYIRTPLIDKLLSFSLTGSFLNQDESDFKANDTKSAGSDPEYKRKNLNTKFILTPDENNKFTLGYMYSKQERTWSEGKSIAKGEEDTYQKSIKYNYSLAHDLKFDNFVMNSYINYDKAKNPTRTNSDTGNGIKFETLTLNTQGTYFFESNALSIGANYKKEKLEDGATNGLNNTITKMDRYQYSLFLEDEITLTDDLFLTLSGRYDYNEDFGSHFSPKAYLVYHLTDNWTLKGGVTSGYKAPSLRQSATDFAGISRGGVMLGNPDLEPEKTINYETSIAYNNSNNTLKSSLTVFQTDFKDAINRTNRFCVPNQPCVYKGNTYEAHPYGYTAYENIDEAQIKGIEFTTDYQITPTLSYRQSYTYTDSEKKSGINKGDPLNDISKHMFNAGLDWEATSKLLLWTQVNYRSKSAGSIPKGADSLQKNPSYTFADAGLVYDVNKDIKLKFGIYNIANEKVTTDDYDMVLDGRRYSFAMNIKF